MLYIIKSTHMFDLDGNQESKYTFIRRPKTQKNLKNTTHTLNYEN